MPKIVAISIVWRMTGKIASLDELTKDTIDEVMVMRFTLIIDSVNTMIVDF